MRHEPYKFDMSDYLERHRNMGYPTQETALRARIDELLKANTEYKTEIGDLRGENKKLEVALKGIVSAIGERELAKVEVEPMPKAITDVFVERRRQKLQHGYTSDADDKHVSRELPRSAASRLLRLLAHWNEALRPSLMNVANSLRPWTETETGHRQTLVVICALLVAEIERMDRRLAAEQAQGVTITNTPRAARCNRTLAALNPSASLPRTCAECGLGPCKFSNAS